MKIFDYKFLILLGLTLVVYFLYREVERLKKEIKNLKNNNNSNNKLEDEKNKLLNDKDIDTEYQIPLPSNNAIIENKINEEIDEEINEEINEEIYQSNKKKINIPINYNNEKIDQKMDEKNFSVTSDNKIEIYSNDNDENT